MIHATEIAFSCYAVNDFDRARGFYEGVLGLKATSLYGAPGGPQWAEYELGSATLAIGCAPQFKPGPDGCTVALEVADFDAAVDQLKQKDVKFRLEPIETPVCRMAMVFDPDGNSLCLHKRKQT